MLSTLCVLAADPVSQPAKAAPAGHEASVAADWPPQVSAVQHRYQKHVYHRAADGSLEHRWADGGSEWYHEFIAGPNIVGTPSATRDTDVYARNTSGYLHHWWYDGGGWHNEQLGHAPIADSPNAVVYDNGDHHVWARGTNGRLHHWWWTPSTGWGHHDMGGPSISGVPSGTTDTDVYARSTSGYLQHWWWAGSSWQHEQLGHAPIADSPNAVAYGGGEQHVWARGTNSRMQHWWWTPSTGWGHQDMGGPNIVGTPNGTADAQVYATDANGYVYRWWWTGSFWQREQLTQFATVPSPSVMVYDGWEHNVYFFQRNGTLTWMWYDGGWFTETF